MVHECVSNRFICKKGEKSNKHVGRHTFDLITVVNDRYLHDLQIGSAFWNYDFSTCIA